MKLSCVHCGQEFSITAQQLGGRGRCPHCQGVIQLPNAEDDQPQAVPAAGTSPRQWLENSISTLGSLVFHMALVLLLALISFDSHSGEGLGEDVLIGTLPTEHLSLAQEEELKADTVTPDTASTTLDEMLEIESPLSSLTESTLDDFALSTPSPSGGDVGSFDLGSVAIGGGGMAGGSWDGLLQNLRRNGLDIVIVFDSTGSMGGEISQVKQQIKRIGTSLLTLVPKTRISICTYRDTGDEYVVKGLPLTSDIQQIEYYLANIHAGGGGDYEEAVHKGLQWAIANNQFQSRARKIILLFGDAPPHQQDLPTCLRLAADFSSQQNGIVSTVTCRDPRPLSEFVQIAQMGGGEAFLTRDERQIMTQLLVLVFGSQYRSKVTEAFQLLDEG